MKLRLAIRALALPALLGLAPLGAIHAQSVDPTPATTPSKPAAENPTPAPTEAASPADSPAAKPAKPQRSAEEKAARKAERIRKYDTNHDGKLDEKEIAAMRADRAKAKASPTP